MRCLLLHKAIQWQLDYAGCALLIHAAAVTPMIGRAPQTRLSWEAEVAFASAPLFTGELIYVQLVSPLM